MNFALRTTNIFSSFKLSGVIWSSFRSSVVFYLFTANKQRLFIFMPTRFFNNSFKSSTVSYTVEKCRFHKRPNYSLHCTHNKLLKFSKLVLVVVYFLGHDVVFVLAANNNI